MVILQPNNNIQSRNFELLKIITFTLFFSFLAIFVFVFVNKNYIGSKGSISSNISSSSSSSSSTSSSMCRCRRPCSSSELSTLRLKKTSPFLFL